MTHAKRPQREAATNRANLVACTWYTRPVVGRAVIAPLDADGVPQLGRQIVLVYPRLVQLRGVEQDDLIPIELEDWIALAAPVNTDPLGGR